MKSLLKLATGMVAGLVMGLTVAAPAKALSLIGSSITAGYEFPCVSCTYGGVSFTTNPFVVGAGSESVGTVDGHAMTDIDFSALSLVLSVLTPVGYTSGSMNGYIFSSLAGYSVLSVIVSGGQSVSAFITSGVLYVNWAGQSFSPGDTVTVNFGPGVPEPSTWALMLLGFAGLGWAMHRRRSAVAA